MDAAGRALRTPFGTHEVGLGLGQTKTELGIFDDDKRVALLHLLELRKTNLADKTLHAAVLGHNVLTNTGIIGHFATTEMHKLTHGICATTGDADNDDGIINVGCDLLLFHLD